ncbi:hypothetical protein BGZ65_004148 [Modicella reniformis]|uniref:Mediator of RNA polymerase II transcription subunit 9 n=1 Tax=Modicella reniformis TaxID=1440133 RepID=A0A9P6IZF5_9FUNG|nr:hypothetical protein BGZ65_004148 [Modicella reniformis]
MSTLTTLTSTTTVSGDAQHETELTFQPSDFSFLSQLLHILQKVETGEDAQEIATLAANLKTSFKRCQTILDLLPGADLSPDEQTRILEEEVKVLEKKKAQLSQYLAWQIFQNDSTKRIIKEEEDDDDDDGNNTPILKSLLPTESETRGSESVSLPFVSSSASELAASQLPLLVSVPVPAPGLVDIDVHPSDRMDQVMAHHHHHHHHHHYHSQVDIKDEYLEPTPPLTKGESFLSESSSQSFTTPSQQSTEHSLEHFQVVKMEEDP